MADGPLPPPSLSSPASSSSSTKTTDPTKTNARAEASSSYNGDIVLGNGVDVIDGNLQQEQQQELTNENQRLIKETLRLQRDLLQLGIAAPVQLKLVEQTMSDFREFCAANREAADAFMRNGQSRASALLANAISTSSSSSSSAAGSLSCDLGKIAASIPRREMRRQQRQRHIAALLEQVSRTPIDLMFGVRIRRKYAEEISKRYGFEPQPYYADLSDTESLSSSTSIWTSSEGEDDESSTEESRIGYNSTRINGVTATKKVPEGQSTAKTDNGSSSKTMSTSNPPKTTKNKSPKSPQHQQQQDSKKVRKAALLPTPTIDSDSATSNNPSAQKQRKKPPVVNGGKDSLDVLNWMDRLRVEVNGGGQSNSPSPSQRSSSTSKNGAKAMKSLPVYDEDEDFSIPPEAMTVLQEALVAAVSQEDGQFNEELDHETARMLATNFIKATSAAASATQMAALASGQKIPDNALPSSSTAAAAAREVAGLSHEAAIDVWKEIQQYLRNLCHSNPAAHEFAAQTAERLRLQREAEIVAGKAAAASMKPLPDLDDLDDDDKVERDDEIAAAQRAIATAERERIASSKQTKKQKRRLAARQQQSSSGSAAAANKAAAELALEKRRRELIRLKRQEHALVVEELRRKEQELLERMAATARIDASPPPRPKISDPLALQRAAWLEYKPVERPPYRVGAGPWGATYERDGEDFAITAHTAWLDDAMIGRGMRVYLLIRAFERRRLYDICAVRQEEVQFYLRLHCLEHSAGGFLQYLCCSSGEEKKGKTSSKSKKPSGTNAAKSEWLSPSAAETDFTDLSIEDATFYDSPCEHEWKWSGIGWTRMRRYHERFRAIDNRLPELTGDFAFLMKQLHLAYESFAAYTRSQSNRGSVIVRRHSVACECNDCAWERDNIHGASAPSTLPYDAHRHAVELFLPMGCLLAQPPATQRRLLRHQAQLAEKCVIVSRESIVEEECEWALRQRATNANAPVGCGVAKTLPSVDVSTNTATMMADLDSMAAEKVDEVVANNELAANREVAPPLEVNPIEKTTAAASKKRRKRK